MNYVLSYDLGTGGVKSSLFDENGRSAGGVFQSYPTDYPEPGFQLQSPEDWWAAVVETTRRLLSDTGVRPGSIRAIGVSGHSLGVVALDLHGVPVWDKTPIWSDSRGEKQADRFFRSVSQKEWYRRTGNGFPPAQYPLFKLMWYREQDPEAFRQVTVHCGTKDYVNYLLTGVIATDVSYASGSGAFDLIKGAYHRDYIEKAGLDPGIFPEILPSDQVLGSLKAWRELGLSPDTAVVCGGVDNACMALGAGCFTEGRAYTSLGTSAWVAVSAVKPILDNGKKPYVFAYCVPGQYVSATCIFSAGRSLEWARDVLYGPGEEKPSYREMDALAERSGVGARGILFNPSLSGGSSLDPSPLIRGCFTGLSLMHGRGDLIRAVLEGVALNLRMALDTLEEFTAIDSRMLLVGGGAKSPLWRRIFADCFHKTILQSAVCQDTGALGAAVLAAKGCGLWSDYSLLRHTDTPDTAADPDEDRVRQYEALLPVFKQLALHQYEIALQMQASEGTE